MREDENVRVTNDLAEREVEKKALLDVDPWNIL